MIRINLLPTKAARKKEDAIVQLAIGAIAMLVMAGVCYFINMGMSRKVQNEEKTIAELRTKIDRLASIKKEVEQFKKKRQDLESKIRTIKDLNEKRSGPVKLLEEFTYVLPRKAWITKYRESDKRLTLEGTAMDGPTISDFVDNMRKSKFFNNIELIQVQQVDKKGQVFQNFTVNCTVNYLAGQNT